MARLLEQIRGKKEQTVDLLLPELIVRSTCAKKKEDHHEGTAP